MRKCNGVSLKGFYLFLEFWFILFYSYEDMWKWLVNRNLKDFRLIINYMGSNEG